MTAIDNTPENRNFLSPLNFKFSIKKSPNMNFFLQKVNLPSITQDVIVIPTNFNPLYNSGTTLQYGDLNVTFKVDEDLTNYFEIHNWMRFGSLVENFDDYSKLAKVPDYTGEGMTSELSLIVLNSAKKPNYEFTFQDGFPIYLSELDFDSTMDDVDYMTATATFKYTLFEINKIV